MGKEGLYIYVEKNLLNENSKDRFLYKKLLKIIKDAINLGIVLNGDWLPSERELSQRLSISRITIRKTLNLLNEDGFLEKIPKLGTKVNVYGKASKSDSIYLSKKHKITEVKDIFSELKANYNVSKKIISYSEDNNIDSNKKNLDDQKFKYKCQSVIMYNKNCIMLEYAYHNIDKITFNKNIIKQTSAFKLLSNLFQNYTLKEVISAKISNFEESKLLNIDVDNALLILEQSFFNKEVLVAKLKYLINPYHYNLITDFQ